MIDPDETIWPPVPLSELLDMEHEAFDPPEIAVTCGAAIKHEAFELWAVCFDQVERARERLDARARLVLALLRTGGPLAAEPYVRDAFEDQDELELAEAALSTAREQWDAAP